MNELLTYLLKTALIQCVLLFCYRLLLQHDTFYKMIRYYFIGGLAFSYVAPLIRFDFRILPQVQDNILQPAFVQDIAEISPEMYRNIEQLPQTAVQWWQQYSFSDILTGIFIAGMAVMLIRFVIQFSSLASLPISQKHKYQTYSILNVDAPIKPFSFGKQIYVNPKLHNFKELDEIIRHELVHIRQRHSIDIIIATINRNIFWWNPFAWILNCDIRNNLEYIVDSEMLQNGTNRKHYQYHLLNINQLTYINDIANYFNFSNFKKRINMMNKEKTQPVYKIKWLLVPLVAAVILLAFNAKRAIATNVDFVVAGEIVEPEPVVEPNPVIIEVDTLAKKIRGKISHIQGIDTANFAINYCRDSTKLKSLLILVDGKEMDSDDLSKLEPKNIHSLSIIKNESLIKEIYGEKGKGGVIIVTTKQNSENVIVPDDWSKKTVSGIDPDWIKPDALIIIDEKESSGEELRKLKQDDIHTFSILKDSTATAIFGDKGKNGVVIVETKQNQKVLETKKILYSMDWLKATNVKSDPLVIVDGRESNIETLNQQNIASLHIIKGDAAAKQYGDKGQNGVIVVETKENVTGVVLNTKGTVKHIIMSDNWSKKSVSDLIRDGVLFIIDEKESNNEEFQKLKPENIESISILKNETAKKLYGDKGANGVVIIKTK